MKRSLSIGVNDSNLPGLEKNAIEWDKMLADNFDFKGQILLGDSTTRQNILEKITHFVQDLKENDMGVIYFSGHGSTKVIENNSKLVQTVLCKDSELIYDFELRNILDKKKTETTLVFISESCHSGNITDLVVQVLSIFEKAYPKEFAKHFENIEISDISLGMLIRFINNKHKSEIIEFGKIFSLLERNSVIEYEINRMNELPKYDNLVKERDLNKIHIEQSVENIKNYSQ